jgi:hypothetical protein
MVQSHNPLIYLGWKKQESWLTPAFSSFLITFYFLPLLLTNLGVALSGSCMVLMP